MYSHTRTVTCTLVCARTRPNWGVDRLRAGFTLIEVLVVVAIIGLLVSILLPSLKRARDQAKTLLCGTNLRQVGQGFYFYTVNHQGRFPGSGAWAEYIRPFLQRSLGKRSSKEAPPGVTDFFEVEVYTCPSDPQLAPTEQRVMDPTGVPVRQCLLLSYAVNENVIWPLEDLSAARQNQDYSIIKYDKRWVKKPDGTNLPDKFGEAIPAGMRTIAEVKRPSDVILCMDAGDDEVGVGNEAVSNPDRAYWNWDIDLDTKVGSGPQYGAIEVHHPDSDNFLFVDGHVSLFKVIKSAVREGVPPVPRYWVPELMNVSTPKP